MYQSPALDEACSCLASTEPGTLDGGERMPGLPATKCGAPVATATERAKVVTVVAEVLSLIDE